MVIVSKEHEKPGRLDEQGHLIHWVALLLSSTIMDEARVAASRPSALCDPKFYISFKVLSLYFQDLFEN